MAMMAMMLTRTINKDIIITSLIAVESLPILIFVPFVPYVIPKQARQLSYLVLPTQPTCHAQ
eukprot:scaffold94444_cov22-Prasinocladus_malaysianus.AAC.1